MHRCIVAGCAMNRVRFLPVFLRQEWEPADASQVNAVDLRMHR
jgi:hypothetical protein